MPLLREKRTHTLCAASLDGSGMRTKRHSEEEIAAKLRQAEEIAAQGKTQMEIARALGITVMTFHRWRKRRASRGPTLSGPDGGRANAHTQGAAASRRVRELEVENSRLRRVVVDLMLRKLELEEALHPPLASQAPE
jgi:putative transposase